MDELFNNGDYSSFLHQPYSSLETLNFMINDAEGSGIMPLTKSFYFAT